MTSEQVILREPVLKPLMDAVVLSTTRTATFDMTGWNWAELSFLYTYAAATSFTWYVEYSDDSGTNWVRPPMTQQDFTAATVEHKVRTDTYTTGAASVKFASVWNLPYGLCRLTVIPTGGTTDVLTVRLAKVVM